LKFLGDIPFENLAVIQHSLLDKGFFSFTKNNILDFYKALFYPKQCNKFHILDKKSYIK